MTVLTDTKIKREFELLHSGPLEAICEHHRWRMGSSPQPARPGEAEAVEESIARFKRNAPLYMTSLFGAVDEQD